MNSKAALNIILLILTFTSLFIISCFQKADQAPTLDSYYVIPDIHNDQNIVIADSYAFNNEPEKAFVLFKIIYQDTLANNTKDRYVINRMHEIYNKYQLYYLEAPPKLDQGIDIDTINIYINHIANKYYNYQSLDLELINKCTSYFLNKFGQHHHLTIDASLNRIEFYNFKTAQFNVSQELLTELEKYFIESKNETLDRYWFYHNSYYAYFYKGQHLSALKNIRLAKELSNSKFQLDNYLLSYANMLLAQAYYYVETNINHIDSFKEAIDFLDKTKYHKLHQLLLSKRIAYDDDLIRTPQVMIHNEKLKGLIKKTGIDYINIDRYMAMNYDDNNRPNLAVASSKLALNYRGLPLNISLLYLGNIYYCLQNNYSKLGNSKEAIKYLNEYLKSRYNYSQNDIQLDIDENINEEVLGQHLDYVVQASKLHLNTYHYSNSKEDLKKAISYSELAHQNFKNWYKGNEEDEYLHLLNEKRQQAKFVKLSALYELYKENSDNSIIDDIGLFLERSRFEYLFKEKMINTYLQRDTLLTSYFELKNDISYFKLNSNIDIQINDLDGKISRLKELNLSINLKYNFDSLRIAEYTDHLISYNSHLKKENSIHISFTPIGDKVLIFSNNGKEQKVKVKRYSQKKIKEFYDYCSDFNTPIDSFLTIGYNLYELLLQESLKDQKYGHIYITPEGSFEDLPFEALPTSDMDHKSYRDVPFLITKISVSYSKYLKSILNDKEFKEPKILALGYSGQNTIKENKTSSLYGAMREIESIKSFQLDPIVLSGKEATTDRFLGEISKYYDIVHLAMHGQSNPNNKLDNFLLFNENSVDTLYGIDISSHSLPTQLVILSACQTSSGDIKTAEGQYSLSRYFSIAGAKNIISTRWSISDYATERYFNNFYEKRNFDIAESDQQSKISLINDLRTSAPFFWAAIRLSHY